jgi:hypothetical protein
VPSFVPAGSSTFSVEDGRAVIKLEGVAVHESDGRSLLNRATLVVVDGPNDEGFLVARFDDLTHDRAPSDWDRAVAVHGGTWVLFDSGRSIFARGGA